MAVVNSEKSVMLSKKHPKYLVLAPSHPLPISNGSHLDTLGVIETLTKFEAEVLVMSFSKKTSLDSFKSTTIFSAPRSRNLFKLFFGVLPWQATSRKLNSKQITMATNFAPDHIVCIQEYALVSLRQIERELGYSPGIILRRANDEVEFIRAARTGVSIPRRIYLKIEEFRFHILEKSWSQRHELELWDIAPDFECIGSQIMKNTGPVFPNLPYDLSRKKAINKKTITYVGNLSLGHCIEGLRWFILNCWETIAKLEPESKLVFAGLNPPTNLLQLAKQYGVQIIANPLETDELLINSSVFINPIFQGSGVNMKLCRPAQLEIPIVSTHFGARGYSEKMKSLKVTSNPDEFIAYIIELLRNYQMQRAIGSQLKSEIQIFLGNNEQNEIYKILCERHYED